MENKENKRQVLVVVEGAKTDVRLMKRLFDIYGLSARHTIVPYKTNSRNNFPDAEEILESQINLLNEKALIYVLSTCGFYIYDYNPTLLEED